MSADRRLSHTATTKSLPAFAEFASVFCAGYNARKNGADDDGEAFAALLMSEYEKWAATRFESPLLSIGAAYDAVREAVLAPDHFTKQLRNYGGVQGESEPLDRWQTRAVLASIGRLPRLR